MIYEDASPEQIQDALDEVAYRAELGVRYHQRRRGFFDGLVSLLLVLSIFGASGAVALVLSKDVNADVKAAVLVVLALAQAVTLGVRPDQKAREHARLAAGFVDVERALRSITRPTPEVARAVTARLLDVERDEPPTKKVVLAMVRNDCARRVGDPARVKLSWPQRLFAHFFDVRADRLELLAAEGTAPRA